MERTIRVTGKGKLSVRPDTIRLLITQQNVEKTYEGAFAESAAQKEILVQSLSKIGFAETALKTLSFRINTETEGYQTKEKTWKYRLVGYRYVHSMKLEFPFDNKTLGRVLSIVAHCPGKPEFSIEYTVADPEKEKNKLLENAVKDSMNKAIVLTQAAGVKLGMIVSMDYSWGEINFVSRPLDELSLDYKCCIESSVEPESIHMNIEADDINVTDNVTVVWSIL